MTPTTSVHVLIPGTCQWTLQMWLNYGFWDYPGLSSKILNITKYVIRERQRQTKDNVPTKGRWDSAGFKNGGRGHQPGDTKDVALEKLEKQVSRFSL